MPSNAEHLTILGCSPAWQNSGGACSAYLIDAGGSRVLVDCGNGAFGALRSHCDYATVDAIAITHTHGDHMLDLLPFAYALLYSPRARAGGLRHPVLWLPPGAADRIRSIFALIDRAELLDLAFDVREYRAGSQAQIGGLTLEFTEVPHFVPTHAIAATAPGGGRVVFGADSRPCPEIADFAQGASIAVLEATLQAAEDGVRGHMTAAEAAAIAAGAGVGRLVLTHITDELPREDLLASALEVHPGAVLARPGMQLPF